MRGRRWTYELVIVKHNFLFQFFLLVRLGLSQRHVDVVRFFLAFLHLLLASGLLLAVVLRLLLWDAFLVVFDLTGHNLALLVVVVEDAFVFGAGVIDEVEL